jgi:hypothetical protein
MVARNPGFNFVRQESEGTGMMDAIGSRLGHGNSRLSGRGITRSNFLRWPGYFAIVALLLANSGCGTVQVNTASDPAINFGGYHTFNFKAPMLDSNPAYLSEVNENRVKSAIQIELEQRGLTLSAPTRQPDLLVSFYLRMKQKPLDLEHPTAEGDSVGATMANFFGRYYKSGQSLNQQDRIPYQGGSLVIDVADVKANRVVWRGIVTDVLYQDQSDEHIQRRIREAVHSAFKRFPR